MRAVVRAVDGLLGAALAAEELDVVEGGGLGAVDVVVVPEVLVGRRAALAGPALVDRAGVGDPGDDVAAVLALVDEGRVGQEGVREEGPPALDGEGDGVELGRAAAPVERLAGARSQELRDREVVVEVDGLGSKRVIQRRFNLAVPRARVREPTFMLRDRSER